MNITYWEIANGDNTREYSKIFFDFGIMCLGPGYLGEINENSIAKYREIAQWKKVSPILNVKKGDRIVLKNGRRIILAVGEVEEFKDKIYNYSDVFSDIDGWELQHFVKVKWKDIKIKYDLN